MSDLWFLKVEEMRIKISKIDMNQPKYYFIAIYRYEKRYSMMAALSLILNNVLTFLIHRFG